MPAQPASTPAIVLPTPHSGYQGHFSFPKHHLDLWISRPLFMLFIWINCQPCEPLYHVPVQIFSESSYHPQSCAFLLHLHSSLYVSLLCNVSSLLQSLTCLLGFLFWYTIFFFILFYFKIYFIDSAITVVPFPPFTLLHPAHTLPPTFLPYSPCPWIIHISSLASTFPILFLPLPCLSSTYHLCYLFSVLFPPLPLSLPCG